MAKRVIETKSVAIVNGKVVVQTGEAHKPTKHQQQSLTLIGWTAGPKNKRERFWRNLVG